MTTGSGMRIGVVGIGVVGDLVARMLARRDSVESVVLSGGSQRRRTRLVASLGVPVTEADPELSIDELDVDLVVICTPDETQLELASTALTGGIHVVSLGDSAETVEALLGLDEFAAEIGRAVIVGAGASPGLSSALAIHAATLFDDVEEISVAVAGAGGPACGDRRTKAVRSDSQEWRDGEWVDVSSRSGTELVWFPEPLGAVDCSRGDLSEPLLLHRRFEDVALLTAKLGRRELPSTTRMSAKLRRRDAYEPGGVRVAVSGWIESVPSTVVYGSRTGLATTSAVTATCAALHVLGEPLVPGARPFAETVPARVILKAMSDAGEGCVVYDGND